MKDPDAILQSVIERLRAVTDSEAVTGKPVVMSDGTVMIPVNKVSCGFVAGGGEYGAGKESAKTEAYPGAAASGGGMTVTPLGFFVCGKEKRFIPVEAQEREEGWKELLRAVVRAAKRKDDEK